MRHSEKAIRAARAEIVMLTFADAIGRELAEEVELLIPTNRLPADYTKFWPVPRKAN